MDDRTRIVCFGDSITLGSPGARWPQVFQKLIDNWRPKSYLVINQGRSGDTSAYGFDRLEEAVVPNLPALVFIEFGINDSMVRPWALVPRATQAEFEKNLREYCRVISAGGGTAVFIVNHLLAPKEGKYAQLGNGRPYQMNLEPYNDIIRRVSTELEAPMIDLPRAMNDNGVAAADLLDKDGVHLSRDGATRYAELVFQEFKKKA